MTDMCLCGRALAGACYDCNEERRALAQFEETRPIHEASAQALGFDSYTDVHLAPLPGYIEPYPGLRFQVLVHASKRVFGHIRLRITPVVGEGSAWVDESKVRS